MASALSARVQHASGPAGCVKRTDSCNSEHRHLNALRIIASLPVFDPARYENLRITAAQDCAVPGALQFPLGPKPARSPLEGPRGGLCDICTNMLEWTCGRAVECNFLVLGSGNS